MSRAERQRRERDDIVEQIVEAAEAPPRHPAPGSAATVVGSGDFAAPAAEKPGFVVGWCSAGSVDANFCDSIASTIMYDAAECGRRVIGTIGLQSGPRIVEARSQIVDSFLVSRSLWRNDRPPEWLVMVDSDMDWEPDAMHRLVDSAIAQGSKIMGGLCIGGGYSSQFPTLYSAVRDSEGNLGMDRVLEWTEGAVVEVDATGAAFLAVHRDVYIALAERFHLLPDGSVEPHPWFIEGRRAGSQYGEDIGFCLRARACGFDVMVDTSIETGHNKRTRLTRKSWAESRA